MKGHTVQYVGCVIPGTKVCNFECVHVVVPSRASRLPR
ncbi:hypothetical protein GGD64_008207 [Bradyrhizobium sp. CIR3A]|nr:hypothetical protein [Bradyrhizobium sp. CIR3A]